MPVDMEAGCSRTWEGSMAVEYTPAQDSSSKVHNIQAWARWIDRSLSAGSGSIVPLHTRLLCRVSERNRNPLRKPV